MAKFGFSKEGNLKEIRRGDAALRTLLLPVNKFGFSDLAIFKQNLRFDTDQRLDFIPNNHKFLVPINSPNVGPSSSTIFIRGISDVSPNVISGTKNLSIEIGDGVLCSPNSDIVAGGSFSLNKIVSVTKPVEGLDDIGTISLSSQIRNGEGAADESEFYSASNKPNGYVGGGVINAFKNRRNENEKIAIIKQNLASYDSATGRFTFGTDIDLTFTEGDFVSKINVKGHADSPFDIVRGGTYFNKRVGDTQFGSSFYPLVVSEYDINDLGQTSFILKRPETNSPVLFNKLKVGHENVYGHNLVLGKVLQVNELEGGTFSAPEQNDQTISNITQSTTHGFTMGDTGVSTSGSGTEYSFTIKRDVTSYSISATANPGDNFSATDTITILGTQLGGTTPANDCTITVDSTFTHSGTKTGVLNTTVTGTPNTTNLLTTTGSGTGLDISIKTQALRIIKVTIDDGGTGHKVGDIITCPKENVTSGTLDLKFKISSATTIYNAESPQLMIFNSPNIIQFTRQLPVSDSDLRGLVPPILRAQGGPRSLIKLGDDQVAGSGSVKNIYRHFENLGQMYNLSGTTDSFSNTEASWQDTLNDHTLKDVINQIQGEVNVAEENSLQKISSVDDNINTSSQELVIDGALQIQDPVGVNDIANLADNVFNNCPHAPAVYIKEEDANNPGTFSYTRAFSTFDGPWTADISAGKKHIRTFETDDQDNAEFVTTLNIGKLEFVDRFVIEDYASKNITEPSFDQGGGQFTQPKVNAPAGAFTSSLNSPRSTGFTHKMPIVIKEKDSTTGEENDATYFLLLKGPLT
jgi:hypothetical protein